MDYPHEIFVKDYFKIHNYYSDIYGKNRTIILMQVGSFHEAYCTDTDGIDLVQLSQHLDIFCTRKNSNIPISISNPRMVGFPIYVTHNFIDKLIDLNYTIVLIDQIANPSAASVGLKAPPKPERKVVGIFSPATHIENKKITNINNLISIVLDKVKDTKTNLYQLCIGISSYDLATGEGCIYETYSKSDDILMGLDNIQRFLEKYPPREIILENNLKKEDIIANMNATEILNYLGIVAETTYTINIYHHKKISWQKVFLEQIYKLESNINIIEILGLEFLNWARLSLVLLLDYVMAHQPQLVSHLSKPEIFASDKYLYLGNRALDQLDIIQKTNQDTCLFKIINYTKTQIGKRYLYNQLTMPLIDHNELNKRYELINILINKNHENNLIQYLEDIYDLDKLIRKLEINIINPCELYQLYISFYQINKLFEYLLNNNLDKLFNINTLLIKQISEILCWIESKFIIDKINNLHFNNFFETEYSFYVKNNYTNIDQLQEQIDLSQNFMQYLIKTLEGYINDKQYLKKTDDKPTTSLITLKYNDREGHYLLLTNRRCELLKNKLAKEETIKIGDTDSAIILKVCDLVFTELPKSSNTKITSNKMQETSKDLVILKQTLAKKLKELFKIDMDTFSKLYINVMHTCTKHIAYIDFINSGALCAVSNHYSKPTINLKSSSYFKAVEMRHPIIEKISTQTTYKPYNIELGFETEQDGALLYGINSSGKSTLMKSIGLNIILAQIGYYTACTHFEYSPYTSLFTRICGNDNMFKAMSAFMVEMTELMAILKRNNNTSLIIGDEICRGTEEKSANIIVCYMLETLAKSGASFITATHLHQIANMETVIKLNRVKAKHLKITYDPLNDTLIYDRQLSDGQGETFYGLQVAKYLMKDKLFNERTSEILNEYEKIIPIATSKYNSEVYLQYCEICKIKSSEVAKLETHHIVWQKDFDDQNINNKQLYLYKNIPANLVTLCTSCHDKVDRNEIIINGWLDTTTGKKLDYEFVEKPNKISKYSDEIINYIKLLQNETKSDIKITQIKIKEKYNKKITSKTINNLWLN